MPVIAIIIIIVTIVVYCGLVVHVTDANVDTRAQKWLAIQQCALQNQCLHMTNIKRNKILYHHHNCIVIHKSTKNG